MTDMTMVFMELLREHELDIDRDICNRNGELISPDNPIAGMT